MNGQFICNQNLFIFVKDNNKQINKVIKSVQMTNSVEQISNINFPSIEISEKPKKIISNVVEICQHKGSRVRGSKSQVQLKQGKKLMIDAAQLQRKCLNQRLKSLSKTINQIKNQSRRASIEGSNPSLQSATESIQTRDLEIKKRRKLWKEVIEGHRQKEQIKKKKMEEQLKQSIERIRNERKERKKKEIVERLEIIEERMKKRDQEIKEGNQRYIKVKKVLSMHQKMSLNYQLQQLSLLEEQKKKLSEIHSLRRPIDENELKEHSKKVFELMKQKQQRRKQRKVNNPQQDKPVYKSIFYKKILQDTKIDLLQQKLDKSSKMRQFSTHVKQNYIPQIDDKKRKQLLEYIQNQKQRYLQKQQLQKILSQRPRQLGLEYLSALRKIPKKQKRQSSSQPFKTDKILYQNYIVYQTSNNGIQRHWKQILNSGEDKQQKGIRIKMFSQKKEMQLKRKEQKSKILGKEGTSEIDDEYFRMMKAKLDYLANQK